MTALESVLGIINSVVALHNSSLTQHVVHSLCACLCIRTWWAWPLAMGGHVVVVRTGLARGDTSSGETRGPPTSLYTEGLASYPGFSMLHAEKRVQRATLKGWVGPGNEATEGHRLKAHLFDTLHRLTGNDMSICCTIGLEDYIIYKLSFSIILHKLRQNAVKSINPWSVVDGRESYGAETFFFTIATKLFR